MRGAETARGTKGGATREAVLEQAVRIAGKIGLSGLTIGMLATATGMSKSGLFAHFGSKEALQLQVLARARDVFTDNVIRPSLKAPRGEPRVRALFGHWLEVDGMPGAPCLFAAASSEYDDQPGVVREQVIQGHRDFADSVQTIFRTGIAEGHFRADADAEQFEHELNGIMLAFLHAHRLLGDPTAGARATVAFERLLASVKVGSAPDGQPAATDHRNGHLHG